MLHFGLLKITSRNLISNFLNLTVEVLDRAFNSSESRRSVSERSSLSVIPTVPRSMTFDNINRPLILIEGKHQRNKVTLTVNNFSDHPLYTLQLKRDISVLCIVTNRFAAHRDLYNTLIADERYHRLVTNEFPPTKTRSMFGIKLSDEIISERRLKLYKVSNYVFRQHFFLKQIVANRFSGGLHY
jgi:hypothetical protein